MTTTNTLKPLKEEKMIERKHSFGCAEFNKRVHIIVDMDLYHGPICRVGKNNNPNIMTTQKDDSLSIHDVNCAFCKRTVTYFRLLRDAKQE